MKKMGNQSSVKVEEALIDDSSGNGRKIMVKKV